ncbi:MAG: ATP-binding protein, partial [Algoriphagus sp.]
QLQIQNETYKVAEENANFGSYMWEMNTGLLVYSDNLFRIFGFEPQEFTPTFERFQSLIHPDDLELVNANAEKTIQTGKLVEEPYRIINNKGEIRHLRSSGGFTGGKDNRMLIGTVQDITKDLKDAEILRAKNIELENANAELNSFTYIASHDLQEPLRKIKVFSNLILESGELSDSTKGFFNRITDASERMRNLIISLLDFSRVNKTDLVFEACDLNKIVEESKIDLNLSIESEKVIIDYANLPTINGLPSQLNQLFTNLLDNAIKYSRSGVTPHITITATIVQKSAIDHPAATHKAYHVIKISDNGIGFDNEYSSVIFEIFQRLHNKNDYSGTGIGLAIVKKIVTNHQGFILAEGNKNLGSIFTVYIPTL